MRKMDLGRVLPLGLAMLLLAGCAAAPAENFPSDEFGTGTTQELQEAGFTDAAFLTEDGELVELLPEAVAMADVPALPDYMAVSHPGTSEKKNGKAVIDYSNISDGYVMVQFTEASEKRLKAVVKGPTTQYQYNLAPQTWYSLPLSDGNGKYQIGIYQNVTDNKYSGVLSLSTDVTLTDEFGPFLHSNQYVDFEAAPEAINKAVELCQGLETPLEKVEAVYTFVVNNLTYDKELAASVKSGYLPVLDDVLAKKKGICFDYAALMTGMLRSQNVPCKLVVGYAGTAYHAWISVWSEADGWIEGAVYFNGEAWQRMDPTFASSGKQSETIMKYIGDGKNYNAKYFY